MFGEIIKGVMDSKKKQMSIFWMVILRCNENVADRGKIEMKKTNTYVR